MIAAKQHELASAAGNIDHNGHDVTGSGRSQPIVPDDTAWIEAVKARLSQAHCPGGLFNFQCPVTSDGVGQEARGTVVYYFHIIKGKEGGGKIALTAWHSALIDGQAFRR